MGVIVVIVVMRLKRVIGGLYGGYMGAIWGLIGRGYRGYGRCEGYHTLSSMKPIICLFDLDLGRYTQLSQSCA